MNLPRSIAKAIAAVVGAYAGIVTFAFLSILVVERLHPSFDWVAGFPAIGLACGIGAGAYTAVVAALGGISPEGIAPDRQVTRPPPGVAEETPRPASDNTTSQKEAVELLGKLHQLHLDGAANPAWPRRAGSPDSLVIGR